MSAPDRVEWMETEATVVSCRYQFARMNTLTMGIRTGNAFRIAFEYRAHGQMYSGEFQSPRAIPQNEKVPIRYNPLRPQENTYSIGSRANSGGHLIAIGVAGSIVLSLIGLAVLRGCG